MILLIFGISLSIIFAWDAFLTTCKEENPIKTVPVIILFITFLVITCFNGDYEKTHSQFTVISVNHSVDYLFQDQVQMICVDNNGYPFIKNTITKNIKFLISPAYKDTKLRLINGIPKNQWVDVFPFHIYEIHITPENLQKFLKGEDLK